MNQLISLQLIGVNELVDSMISGGKTCYTLTIGYNAGSDFHYCTQATNSSMHSLVVFSGTSSIGFPEPCSDSD